MLEDKYRVSNKQNTNKTLSQRKREGQHFRSWIRRKNIKITWFRTKRKARKRQGRRQERMMERREEWMR